MDNTINGAYVEIDINEPIYDEIFEDEELDWRIED
jgi:hypothetical protein